MKFITNIFRQLYTQYFKIGRSQTLANNSTWQISYNLGWRKMYVCIYIYLKAQLLDNSAIWIKKHKRMLNGLMTESLRVVGDLAKPVTPQGNSVKGRTKLSS